MICSERGQEECYVAFQRSEMESQAPKHKRAAEKTEALSLADKRGAKGQECDRKEDENVWPVTFFIHLNALLKFFYFLKLSPGTLNAKA